MRLTLTLACSMALLAPAAFADPITVNDGTHEITLPDTPTRVVALEFSFVDALASVAVSPVGVADDNDITRLPQAIRDITGPWTSVGLRGQPSIEDIAALSPDLIIADLDRHAAAYDALSAIAPTLLLPSRGEDYADSLKSARLIGEAVGKTPQMDARLTQHAAIMQDYATQMQALVTPGTTVIFGAAREDSLSLHGPDSYDGSVLAALGLTVPAIRDGGDAYEFASIEQLLALDPDYLLVGHYRRPSIIDQWSSAPLWNVLKAAQAEGHVVSVDSNVWARNRGIMAAERIADDALHILQGTFAEVE
ncbi:iron(III) dicitrate-binding periplasmic protein (plasmid) [Ketogulonicigenium vulgare Y25]|uniref:Iron-dicitrate transporter subunit n=1 Tax=Ketogulonicigenium vulgare (strain WSH-001) TaxID=759362 RepID=F9YBH5_KETVW|nr:Fe(3+)-dicitrate ABC transporter substrate-binding protein FecB [Ketogulonicigenium vulgare]ADO44289.1 iron(III) dicitrate-binding periplasmic protein [Ketogulonicigenium vulgare Y25]AEM42727.1 Iron-dicitrate transporter subunit [Ketogulonicigenium vulgare WSH-001]ALJ82824.1 iron-dicitrate transporter substrate-binding subunit [Ketogulonicigenium vulgare]